MGRIKLDDRIRTLIENGIANKHRSMFVIIGEKARDQVVTLHHILSKATISQRPSVLWCYKKNLGFSSHRQKRIKEIKKRKAAGLTSSKEEDIFEQFIASTKIQYCYYAESHRILGNTFGMVVLQDFEALTPNLLARTIETAEGGGLIVILLETITSLKQLYTLSMDVHKRYRTEAHRDVVARFNERFILSLADCLNCLIIDDCLNVLPLSNSMLKIEPIPLELRKQKSMRQVELEKLKASVADTKPIGDLLKLCKTHCQAKVLLRLLDATMDRSPGTTCSITAARGRGKSAALGLAVAGAVGCGITNIFVTSPSIENLRTLFEFILKGLSALNYEEHADYQILKSNDPKSEKCINRINVFRSHRQVIQYIIPNEASKISQAELVVIDEAAAIPIPIVKSLIYGQHMVFLASTIAGYEGTGRSLSLKLLEQLRQKANSRSITDEINGTSKMETCQSLASRTLYELTLEESIRYNDGDKIEEWLNKLLCLNPMSLKNTVSGIPPPNKCELYYVNRDALFSYHPGAECFLAQLVSIYVSAHYKNTPDDLQMLSDAPAHHLFVLMAPIQQDEIKVPQILTVVQVCLEGSLSKERVIQLNEQGKRASGDLIPWILVQHFLDNDFSTLSGARIVRIAVHPEFQSMGYGTQAIRLIRDYYEGKYNGNKTPSAKLVSIKCTEFEAIDDEGINQLRTQDLVPETDGNMVEPRRGTSLPPLLQRLQERPSEQLDWLGVSFGVTLPLLKFWKRSGFCPIYVRQTSNDLTGEHSCIALTELTSSKYATGWVRSYFHEFRHRFLILLGSTFTHFSPHLSLSFLFMTSTPLIEVSDDFEPLSRNDLRLFLSNLDLRRLTQYSKNLADDNLITDLLPMIANLYFSGRISLKVALDIRQAAMLLSVGLQRKSVETTARELDLPISQANSFLNKAIRRLSEQFDDMCREAIDQEEMLSQKLSGNASLVSEMVERMTTGQALPASLDDDDDVPMGLFNRPIKSNKKIRKRKQPTTNENGGDLTLDSLPSP